MKKECRVLITTECNNDCSYCCNKLPEIKQTFKMDTMDNFIENTCKNYEVIKISGGEPMLCFTKLTKLVTGIKCRNENAEIYLYTNGHFLPMEKEDIIRLCEDLDGINVGHHGDGLYLLTRSIYKAIRWKVLSDNVYRKSLNPSIRLHVNEELWNNLGETKHTLNMMLGSAKINLKLWKMNECETEEDRFII